ncbi:MAG: rRNA adenine N-6-methyltransferase family protein [Acidimicrobiales bacterium]
MSGRKRRSDRDQRRRSLSQHFLVDQTLISKLIDDLEIVGDELVVDVGAGSGALTLPLAHKGARVWAVERDPIWADQLTAHATAARLDDRIRVIRTDVRRFRFPRERFRIIANPPFSLTTDILKLILDDPTSSSPTRADLVLQREVTLKHASQPPKALKTASWSP